MHGPVPQGDNYERGMEEKIGLAMGEERRRTLVSVYRAAALELRAAGPICDVQWTGAWEHGMGCVVHGNNERRGVSRRDAYVCGREKKTTGAVWVNEEVTSSFQGMTPRIAANDCISRRVGTAHEP